MESSRSYRIVKIDGMKFRIHRTYGTCTLWNELGIRSQAKRKKRVLDNNYAKRGDLTLRQSVCQDLSHSCDQTPCPMFMIPAIHVLYLGDKRAFPFPSRYKMAFSYMVDVHNIKTILPFSKTCAHIIDET